MPNQLHLLRRLSFPARYEPLVATLGDDLIRLLVAPEQSTLEMLERAALGVVSRGEGLFLPMVAPSGTGKTTLASSLTSFLPNEYAPTTSHIGPVSAESLLGTVTRGAQDLDANDARILPINIDDRETTEPSSAELAAIKRFLREPEYGHRCLIMWPETSPPLAQATADRYREIAGAPPIELPAIVAGPERRTWQQIATDTMRLVNGLDSIEEVGVDPADYDPARYDSLGDFMRAIADDFTGLVHDLNSSDSGSGRPTDCVSERVCGRGSPEPAH